MTSGSGERHLRLPRGDGVDGRQQHLDGIVLGDDRVGLGQRRRHREDVVDVGGVEDDARRVRALLEAEAGAQAIPARQGVVHDDHVGPMTLQRDGELRFARDGAEQPVAGLLVEQLLEGPRATRDGRRRRARRRRTVCITHQPGRSPATRQWVRIPIYGVMSPRRIA